MQIRRALISVWDKTGIVEFARALHEEFGIEITSTGGTARALTEAGIPVTLVETLTGCGEMLGGRVKTLHPAIHAAILADRNSPEHMRQLEAAGIKPIDMVVVNLYPFEKTVADPNCTFEQAIEMIDIGGVALLRAAAKNHQHVLVIANSCEYERFLVTFRGKSRYSIADLHEIGALHAFGATATYDEAIVRWLPRSDQSRRPYEQLLLTRMRQLRYGENPAQNGEALGWLKAANRLDLCVSDRSCDSAMGNPVLSYNNYLDADAALGLCAELSRAGKPRSAKLCFAPLIENRSATDKRRNSARFSPIESDRFSRRNLPHWQLPGATYWIEYSSRIGALTLEERDIALSALKFWDGKRLDLHAAVVMPDHVHAILSPRLVPGSANAYENLSELLQSIKSFSGREISKHRGSIGMAWVHESYDHWIRSEAELRQKWDYLAENVVKEGLASTPGEYRWWYAVDLFGVGVGQPVTVETAIPRIMRGAGRGEKGTGGTGKAELCTTSEFCVSVFVKHTNACGVGIAGQSAEAYQQAYRGDPNAAMGGVLACNFPIDAKFATAVMETYDRIGKPLKERGAAFAPGGFFVEVWIAPAFADDAIEIIRGSYDAEKARAAGRELVIDNPPRKKWGENVRLLAVGDMSAPPDPDELHYRSIAGGMLVQSPDLLGLNEEQWTVATKRAPSDAEMADLRLAWLICKHTKSNAITLVKDGMLIGNGAGQMSRVMSCRIATWLARENGHAEKLAGSVAASDAFFPFADGPGILIDAGVTAIVQPGGSKRDQESIDLCDQRGVAMIFTGTRHFRH